MSTVALRNAIADYVNVGTRMNPIWAFCCSGFNSFDESPNPQVDSKIYINEINANPSVNRYETAFEFDTDIWVDDDAINLIYNIGRSRLTGKEAIVQYIRTDFKIEEDGRPITTIVECRMFDCAVEVSDIRANGGEILNMTGTLHVVGQHIEGLFDIQNSLFITGEINKMLECLYTDPVTGCLYCDEEKLDDRFAFSMEGENLIMSYAN